MTAEVRGYLPRECDGVVLVLHGGGEHGTHHMTWWKPPVLRMIPFARAIRRTAGRRVGVLRMKNEVFGWNGEARSPIDSTRGVIARIRRERPDAPIVLVGHSMGGRVALNLFDEDGVVAIAALAPWVVETDEVHGSAGQRALLMHGLDDRVTDPAMTEALAAPMRERGVDVRWEPVAGEGHAMLSKAWRWHRVVARFAATAMKEAMT